jgi:hypothetical protein
MVKFLDQQHLFDHVFGLSLYNISRRGFTALFRSACQLMVGFVIKAGSIIIALFALVRSTLTLRAVCHFSQAGATATGS